MPGGKTLLLKPMMAWNWVDARDWAEATTHVANASNKVERMRKDGNGFIGGLGCELSVIQKCFIHVAYGLRTGLR